MNKVKQSRPNGERQQLLTEQDQDLEKLSQSLSRIKVLAVNIDEEVTVQDRLLKDLSDDVDKTFKKVKSSTKQIDKLNKKDSCDLL